MQSCGDTVQVDNCKKCMRHVQLKHILGAAVRVYVAQLQD